MSQSDGGDSHEQHQLNSSALHQLKFGGPGTSSHPQGSSASGSVSGGITENERRLPSLAQVIGGGDSYNSIGFAGLDLSAHRSSATPLFEPSPSPSTNLNPLHPGLRRLLLLQTLAARQQAALELEIHSNSGAAPGNRQSPAHLSLHQQSSSESPIPSYSASTPPTPTAPPPTPLHSPHTFPGSPSSPHLPINMPWGVNLDGLNALGSPNSSTPANSTPESTGGIGSVGEFGQALDNVPESLVTQQELDWWRNMAFSHAGQLNAPLGQTGTPMFPLPTSTASASTSTASGLSQPLSFPLPLSHLQASSNSATTDTHSDQIDWSAFFPVVQVSNSTIPHNPPLPLPLSRLVNPYQPVPSGILTPQDFGGGDRTSVENGAPSSSRRNRSNSAPVTGKGKGKAVKSTEEEEEEEFSPSLMAQGQSLDSLDPEEIEEDKRRRNTAASARFRAKKKQRDAELQQTSVQLRDKVSDLERQSQSLRSENKYLRDLISEKAEMDPRLLDVLRTHAAAQALQASSSGTRGGRTASRSER